MPVTTSIAIGTALGVGGGGVAAGVTGAAVIGAAAYGATKGVQALTSSKSGQKQIGYDGGTADRDLAAAQTAAAERAALSNDKRRQAIARSRTVYTSPMGLSSQASTARKTLTGQ